MTKNKLKTKLQYNPTSAPSKPQIPESVIKPINYKAVDYLGWFMSDAQNMRNWSFQLFASDVDLSSSRTEEIKAAAENSLTEIEDNVANLRAFLAEYTPLNKKK